MAQSAVCLSGLVSLEAAAGLGVQKASNASLRASRSVVRASAGRSVSVSASSVSSQEESSSSVTRRSVLSLAAVALGGVALVREAGALVDIKLEGPPAPFGGLKGTENADEARDFDLDLKKRFFVQSLPSNEAYLRVKAAADEIVAVKSLIAKKAWPYVQNDLRSKAQTLGFDIRAILESKSKGEKKELVALKSKLFETINALDYAAREKSSPKAEKYYAETVDLLNKFIAKLA